MYKFMTMLKRDFINILKNPTLLISNTVFTFLLILILGFLNRGAYGDTGVDSYDYYGVTMLIFAVLNVAMTASNSFMEKSLKTSNLRVIYSPIPKAYIYISKILATFLFSSACLILNILLCKASLGVNFGDSESFQYVSTLILLFNLLTSITGVMFCCIFKSEEESNKILSLIMNIFAFLGGIFFPLDGLGTTIRNLSFVSPIKWVNEALFQMIYDKNFSLFAPTVMILIGCCGVFLLICKWTFRTEDYV